MHGYSRLIAIVMHIIYIYTTGQRNMERAFYCSAPQKERVVTMTTLTNQRQFMRALMVISAVMALITSAACSQIPSNNAGFHNYGASTGAVSDPSPLYKAGGY